MSGAFFWFTFLAALNTMLFIQGGSKFDPLLAGGAVACFLVAIYFGVRDAQKSVN